MNGVIIFGAGGHGHVIKDIVESCGDHFLGFLDDNNTKDSIGKITDYKDFPDAEFIIAIGDSKKRAEISQYPLKWHTAIHPSAIVSRTAEIGIGTVIMPNAVINARAKIGNHCIVNTSAVVEHDNVIGDYSHVSVGTKLGGSVIIGEHTWIGIGSTVSNNISICSNCMIGAGSLIIKDIEKPGTYFGSPVHKAK